VTGNELARSYLEKAGKRRRVLDVLVEEQAWSDVVREAQQLVELALKGMLRAVGVDPPKWHDAGPLLLEHAERFPMPVRSELERLAGISQWLRKERELSFSGDVDFVPTERYTEADAERARADAVFVFAQAQRVLPAGG